MNRRWLIIVLGILGLLMGYEILSNNFSLFLLVIGTSSLLLRKHSSKQSQNGLLLMGISALLLALLSNRLVLAFLVIGLLLLVGKNPEIFQLILDLLTGRKDIKSRNDFVMVDFSQLQQNPIKVSRNRWLGEDRETEEAIYSWEDINFTKLVGNTVFDLGNTILPKENNIILIRKGIGKTKIIVPEGTAISLNISMLTGKVQIAKKEMELRNETIHWHSTNYQQSARKVKLVANILLGEVEVIFL